MILGRELLFVHKAETQVESTKPLGIAPVSLIMASLMYDR